jgi:preprotein translocase subunit YajC
LASGPVKVCKLGADGYIPFLLKPNHQFKELPMFVSPAYAQAGAEAAGPGALEAFLPIILIFVVFYFLLIRPQQKKAKQHKEMLAAVRRGDKIVTGGGIIGTVTKVVDDNEVMVEVAEGVRVRVHRPLIASVLTKPEPVSESKDPKDPSAGGDAQKPQQGMGSKLRNILGGKSD